MPSTTISHPSYQCRIIITSSTMKKNMRCFQPSMCMPRCVLSTPALISVSQWFNVASIPWSPIARRLLCRPLTGVSKWKETDPFQKGYTTDSPSTWEIIKCVEEVVKVKGISMAQVSLAWTMSKPGELIYVFSDDTDVLIEYGILGVTAPIIGTTSLDNLYDLLGR